MALLETSITTGRVRGVATRVPSVNAFLGIPFAKAPVGELRFSRPVPAEPWEGVRDCSDFGFSCWQRDNSGTPQHEARIKELPVPFRPLRMSEDCLSLNVWTPAESADEKLPVMVWFYGGGMQGGTSDDTVFDGESLCQNGVILVTANYRTGVFGYLAHKELDEENAEHASGNYGLMDQVLALKWVHENISAFGGDAANVSIFGCSGGGRSCQALACTRLSEGLIHHVMIHSAGGLNPIYSTPKEELLEIGERFMRFCGKEHISELRALPAEELQGYYNEFSKDFDNWLNVTDDGYALPLTMDEIVRQGLQQNLDYILSTTNHEIPRLMPEKVTLEKFKDVKFSSRTSIFAAVCDPQTDEEADDYTRFAEAYEMKSAQLAWAMVQARQSDKKPVYLCTFDRPAPGAQYVTHGADQMYAFHTLDKQCKNVPEEDDALSRKLMKYWTNFAKTGNPNTDGSENTNADEKAGCGDVNITNTGCSDANMTKIGCGDALEYWTPFTEDSQLTFAINTTGCEMQDRWTPVMRKLTDTYINYKK